MENMELAVKVGAKNWIVEGTQAAGWYTCILTGKKFRSTRAEAQFALQKELVEASEAMAAGEEPEVVEANEQVLDGQADREEAETDFNKLDLQNLTRDQEERLMEDLGVLNRPQYDAFVQHQSNMSGKLWDHIHSEAVMMAAVAANKSGVVLKEILCCDCGTKRMIKPQDAFQVTRCAICQHKHRNAMRAEKRKAKRAAAKEQQGE